MQENSLETKKQIKWRKYEAKDLELEAGEAERVLKELFNIKEGDSGYKEAMISLANKILEANLQELTDDSWKNLENTDSWEGVPIGGFKIAEKYSRGYKKNFDSLMNAINKEIELPGPIIIDYGKGLHLMSGNTRLMIARGLKQRPKVILIKYP